MSRLLVVLAALLGVGCASHTALAPEERSALKQSLTGPRSERYLRLSSHVTPFFGDASKRLLTPSPPDEVRLLDDTEGKNISPGPVQATVPAGARVRITEVEFPTAWVVTERILYTPRTHPWVYLEVEGAPPGPPLVLVMPRQLKTPEEFHAELGRYLSEQDLGPLLGGFSEPVREAIRQKKAVVGMPAAALEMSWGYPELIQRNLEGGVRNEEWIYPGGRRRAFLTDERLIRIVEDGAEGK
jgi:hypothetical protein